MLLLSGMKKNNGMMAGVMDREERSAVVGKDGKRGKGNHWNGEKKRKGREIKQESRDISVVTGKEMMRKKWK